MNEEKNNTYDVIVIGAGSGGLNVASFCARIGLKTMIVDKSEDHIGGDCLNTGCVPSKTLIAIARSVSKGARNASFGLTSQGTLTIQAVTAKIREAQSSIRERENKEYLEKVKNIDVKVGSASFTGRSSISVSGEVFYAKRFVLATGSGPRKLALPNDGSIRMFTNESIFDIEYLPTHFIFIGGGPISCELGQAFSQLGSKVTILQEGDSVLAKEEPWVRAKLTKHLRDDGVNVFTNVKLHEVKEGQVVFDVGGEKKTIRGDALFIGVGRELITDGLGLSQAGVQLRERGGVAVDKYLRTTNKSIFVVGDIAGNYQFTHAAEEHAKVVIHNMLSPFKKKWRGDNFAWVTYTSPQVATFGVTEKEALSNGCRVIKKEYSHNDRAIIDEDREGEIRVYIDEAGHVHGGTVVANNAESVAQLFVTAMTKRLTIKDLFEQVYPYPGSMRIVRDLAGEVLGEGLTEKVKKMLRALFAFTSRIS